jgi:hypothetical protein
MRFCDQEKLGSSVLLSTLHDVAGMRRMKLEIVGT